MKSMCDKELRLQVNSDGQKFVAIYKIGHFLTGFSLINQETWQEIGRLANWKQEVNKIERR
jgi:hypothetical protein